MTLSKRDVHSLIQAMRFAIDYEESFIDANRTEFAKGKNAYLKPKVVPKENRQAVTRAQRNIKTWLKLIVKLEPLREVRQSRPAVLGGKAGEGL